MCCGTQSKLIAIISEKDDDDVEEESEISREILIKGDNDSEVYATNDLKRSRKYSTRETLACDLNEELAVLVIEGKTLILL